MTWARRTTVLIVLFSMTTGLYPLVGGSSEGSHAVSTWTIMVYMADDTSFPLPWEDNVNSMEAAGQSLGTNILALVDPPGAGNSQLLKIAQDPNPQSTIIVSTAVDDGGAVIPLGHEVNMASPATLEAFINYSITRYPAAHNMLVLWGHGDGWRGLCPDGSDFLTLPELGSALSSVTATMGRRLDIVAVDSCAGSTLEMLFELEGRTDFLVASENNVPYQGLPYTQILSDLAANPDQGVGQFSSRIVHDYIVSAWASSPYSTTMACFNLSAIQPVFDHLSALSTVGTKYERIFHSALNEALASAEHYDTDWYVDFGDLMEQLQKQDQLPLEIRTLAIETAMVYETSKTDFAKFDNPDPADGIHIVNATGAAIYAPSGVFPDDTYGDLAIADSPWYSFSIASRRTAATDYAGPGPTLHYSDSPADEDSLPDAVELTWADSHSILEAWVFRQEPGGYVPCGVLVSTSQSLTVEGFIGRLLIAASASDGGAAVSYDELNVTLYGIVKMTFLVMKDGSLAQSTFDVRLEGDDFMRFSPASNGVLVINLSIPTDLDIGDMILVDIMEPGSNQVLGRAHVVVQQADATVRIDAFSQEGTDPGAILLVFFSALPGLLILLFAAMLYRDSIRRRTG